MRGHNRSAIIYTGLAIVLLLSFSCCVRSAVSADPPLLQETAAPRFHAYLPQVARNHCPLAPGIPLPTGPGSPTIELTYVPPYGGNEYLHGRVMCVTPADYKVAVYIYVSGWWTKPYWDQPLTPIQSEGTWTTNITTGGSDQQATRIAAFLVPNGYTPPAMSGGQSFTSDLLSHAVAQVTVDRQPVFRTIEFSGRAWNVKASETAAGPGPNLFSDRPDDVWVDNLGRLHLKIVYRDGKWYCTEVVTAEPLGYGTYTFTLAGRVDQLDQNVVLGLFTWDSTAPEYNYREIDIEFSRWGEAAGDNAQYVVSPWDHAGNRRRFSMELQGDFSTHAFTWDSGSIQFSSRQGRGSDAGEGIQNWVYTGADLPPAGTGNARINLWLMNGAPPSDGQAVEVIVDGFEFTASQ